VGLLSRAGRRAGALAIAVACIALAAPSRALETDQFYAWRRSLADSSEALNAKVNFELDATLREINARDAGRETTCRQVVEAIHSRFTLFIFQKIELWAQRTAVLSRIPADDREERSYRKDWIYGQVAWYDLSRTVPPSPTIEIDGVRLGTDKISHFFSEGHYYLEWYEAARRRGQSHDEAVETAVRRGIAIETTVLGGVISGVISPADLEANYHGLGWYLDLCEGAPPLLERTDAGWRLRDAFDMRKFVTPEWDESYNPNVILQGRWVHVKPEIERHCSDLEDPMVEERRQAYAVRDTVTYTERILGEMVQKGALPDPRDYGVDRLCAAQRIRQTASVGAGPPEAAQ
jgi:hypothetical protein